MNKKQQPKITATLSIKYEEKKLPAYFEHTKKFVDEWVIVHDGECDDRSIEIIEEYIAKGLDIKYKIEPFIGEPEPQRVKAYKMATHEWLLINDPDQFLNDTFIEAIPELIDQDDIDAYDILRTYYDGKEHHITGEYTTLLYRKSKMWMLSVPHSVVQTRGTLEKLPEKYIAYHEHIQKGKKTLRGQFKSKYNHWARVHAEYLLKEFDEELVFQATEQEWYTKKRARILQHPLVMSMIYLLYNMYKGLFVKKLYRQGWNGMQSAIGFGLYTFLTCVNVWKMQRQQKKVSTQ